MKPVMIIEHNTNSLQKIEEKNNVNALNKYTLGGIFTEFDVKNRNERVYTWNKFEPAYNELNERIEKLGVYGELDHPESFDTSLQKASHLIKETKYNSDKNCVTGKIRLLSKGMGERARSLVDDGAPLFVSSRAAGVTEANGEVSLKKLFTYDIVADPGFGSAKMESINESIGYSSKANFRIYEMKDEQKINELFKMNKNDMITKDQFNEYSNYLVGEISKVNKKITESVKKGNLDPKKLEELLEYYNNLNENQTKITKYLDYLAEKMQIVVNENSELKESNTELKATTEKLIKHNNYLAENLEKAINYSEYIAENLDKTIEYSEYIAENLDKTIEYSEYIAENLDKSIQYGEYIAENLDKNIEFSNYLVENINNSIKYSEYLAENIDTNIAYSEYIAEHLDDGLAYTDYIAEKLDQSITYTQMIAEKLNSSSVNKLFENVELEEDETIEFPMASDAGIEEIEDDMLISDEEGAEEGEEDDTNCRVVCDDDEENIENTPDLEEGDSESETEETEEGDVEMEEELEEGVSESKEEDECADCENEEEEEISESDLKAQIDMLIEKAKKREASKTNEHHFLSFLNKTQAQAFYDLTQDEQETVVAHIKESSYFSTSDVLRLMNEALSTKAETTEDKLIKFMPDDVKAKWDKLSETAKSSMLTQSKLHPNTDWNEQTVEHFWLTRRFPEVKENRELVNKEDKLIKEDNLSDEAMNAIMEKYKSIQ
jgi:hypothetical protein